MPSTFMFLRVYAAIRASMKCLPGLQQKCPRMAACKAFQRMMKYVLTGLRKMDSRVSRSISFNSSDLYPDLWMVHRCLTGSAFELRVALKMHVCVRSRRMQHLGRVSRLRSTGRAHYG